MSIINSIKKLFNEGTGTKTVIQKRTYDKSIPIRYNDIYQEIILAADNMINSLSDYISVPPEGCIECEILLASTIVGSYKKVHLVNAMYMANKDMGKNFYSIEKKLDYYSMLQNKLIWSLDGTETWSYREFTAMWEGEPQFRGLIKPDKYGNSKHIIFTHEKGWMQKCSFFMLTTEQQNADYFIENQDKLIVKRGTATDYVIMPKEYANYNKDVFFDILIYWIYCNPLADIQMLQVDKLSDELRHDKVILNELRKIMQKAFEHATKSLHSQLM